MIISENPNPSLNEFYDLMSSTDILLNKIARESEDYFIGRNGKPLEKDVFSALTECAKGTVFEGSIALVSGSSFPDIVAKKYYGVEVKSTKDNHWTSIGSSILESTRVDGVERIFLTFGKLGKPVQFMSRPYEECLSGIAVTHYPRYQIDMRLQPGETIFDKMGVPYDTLRKMDNPVAPVSAYYKSKLKPGESLWWATNDSESEYVPPTVRLWSTLSREEKNHLTVQSYVLFPEIFSSSSQKYHKCALWLATHKGIVNTNIRDQFSAGGQVQFEINSKLMNNVPAAFGRLRENKLLIMQLLLETDEMILSEYWGEEIIEENRLIQWCNLVERYSGSTTFGKENARKILKSIFF